MHPVPSLPQGIRRKASLSGLRTTGGMHNFSTLSNKIGNLPWLGAAATAKLSRSHIRRLLAESI